MQKFARDLLTEWRKLNLPSGGGAAFVVAVSGGADSLALAIALDELRQLKKLDLRFVVAHFNHELRGEESAADELFVREFAERFEFELACGKLDDDAVKLQNRAGSLEQNARRARYEFLLETAENLRASGVLTAHTLNDQAETFLLNLIRGSGLGGLGGMKPTRNFSNFEPEAQTTENEHDSPFIDSHETGESANPENEIASPPILLVRPLLNWATRERTENFCLANKIDARFDSMNENLAYRRVRIRKVLLPMLADFNPKIVETLAKTANLLRDDYAALGKSATAKSKDFAANKLSGTDVLETNDLKNLFPSVRRQILRDWLKTNRGGDLRRLDSRHLAAIENLIVSRKSGRRIELPGGETIVKSGGRLLFKKAAVEKTRSDNYNQNLDFEGVPDAIENNE